MTVMAQQRPDARPRSKSILSFHSHKSKDSISKYGPESPKEKDARRLTSHSKADPSEAINEAQPAMQALEKPTMESLRAMRHYDRAGNIISDPDRSNPTRPRLERPLDTIRSFEAQINRQYRANRDEQRKSKIPGDFVAESRRTSYFGINPSPRQPVDHGGYYGNGNRTPMTRPMSYVEVEPAQLNYSSHPVISRRLPPRTTSEPLLYGNQVTNGYGRHEPNPSYDAATTNTASSASHMHTDQYTSTNPSSENSSIDRQNYYTQPAKPQQPQADLGEHYGFSGFGGAPPLQGPILEYNHQGPSYGEPGYGRSHQGNGNGSSPYQGNSIIPPRAVQDMRSTQRAPINLNKLTSNGTGKVNGYGDGAQYNARPAQPEKRKSWLKRAFSKNGR